MRRRGRKSHNQLSTFEFDNSIPNPSVDEGYHFVDDGRRAIPTSSNIAPQKPVRADTNHQGHAAEAAQSDANHPLDPEFTSIASTLISNDTYEHYIEEGEATKRKRYVSSDDPMQLWRADKHKFLDNLIRREGLGEYHDHPACSKCDAGYGDGATTRLFRCAQCGPSPQCLDCLKKQHAEQPLHRVKEWTGDFWVDVALHKTHIGDESVRSLNLQYQLGHHGKPCVSPTALQTMVVMDVSGVHTLQVRFCACAKALRQDKIAQLMSNAWYPATTIDPATCATYDALEQFRLLNTVGNLSAHDYVGTLERLTEPTGLEKTPDRYVAFGRMSRQYAFLLRCKRSGVAHDSADMTGVKPGALAVRCWACPVDGFNLPEGWKDCDEDDKFLYSLMLAIDANFRLKNRIRTNEKNDPSLGPGWGCFVETEEYKDHLRDYVAENDEHQHLYRVCGVNGKEYEVDYGLESVGDLSNFEIQFALPVWHAAAHELGCQAAMSLSHKKGVGRTDGEGIERTWSVLNPISFATKEMGEGNRHDHIEDKVDHIGFEKNCTQGDTLARKLVIATAERNKQIDEFIEIDRGIDKELRLEWIQQIEDWLEDESKPNPYVMKGGKDAGPSEAEVAAELKKAEVEEMRAGARGGGRENNGDQLYQGVAPAGRSQHEVRGKQSLTADRAGQIEELRASFFKKLNAIQREQDVFMPGVARLRAAAEQNRDPDVRPPRAEDVKLWLPSELTPAQRQWASRPSLVEVEAKLREAQCGDALTRVRGILYTLTHLIHFRNANAVGQATSTRSSNLIGRVGDRRDREVAKYNGAWRALRELKGPAYAAHFQELKSADLNVRTETESDARARIRLGRLGSGRRARNEPTAAERGEGSEARGMSWIWSAVGEEDEEVRVHEAVRVHWAKARARRDRWIEEVRLLKEERRRVLRSLWSVQEEWRAREARRTSHDPWLAAGLVAYARRQVSIHAQVAQRFFDAWHGDVRAALRGVLDDDCEAHLRLLVGKSEVVGGAEGSVAELEGGA
ncbi:CxC2 domain-containing protein [Mycena kentingensis (nom. inval.)]|nr:CxC2 domain-containing protein [Mycena kentingensis (nom. inval.)]